MTVEDWESQARAAGWVPPEEHREIQNHYNTAIEALRLVAMQNPINLLGEKVLMHAHEKGLIETSTQLQAIRRGHGKSALLSHELEAGVKETEV